VEAERPGSPCSVRLYGDSPRSRKVGRGKPPFILMRSLSKLMDGAVRAQGGIVRPLPATVYGGVARRYL